jgi:hypothetical protein
MAAILAFVVPFAFYWVILFVTCYAVVEFGQSYLYDETTPSVALKVAGGSALLALLLTWTRTEFHSMFTADLGKTVVLGVAAFVVFTLIFQFQPWHALPIGIIAVLLIAGTATMGVQSFANRDRPIATEGRIPAKPIRRSTQVTIPSATPDVKGNANKP